MHYQYDPANHVSKKGDHAVVIGGSMAGLFAARVLSDHFAKVTILERDRCPRSATPRKGVPQNRHAHILLKQGQQILEQLFPGIGNELAGAGAPVLDAAEDVAWLTPAGWAAQFRSEMTLLMASRNLLEWSVRRRVASLPNVDFVEEIDVLGLLPNEDHTAVAGVSIRHRGRAKTASRATIEVLADLVVDATGRGSRAPRWLEELGYTAPEETTVNAFLSYASRVYQLPVGPADRRTAVYLQAQPPHGTRHGLILPMEQGRLFVTLTGRGDDHPPTDEAGFLEYARSLLSPILHETISKAEPLTPITAYRGTANRLRHFERLSRWPDGFVVLGDACCAFNPVYGQGMTTAALGAVALGECLQPRRPSRGKHPLAGVSRHFQKKLAQITKTPWLLATGEDYRYPITTGGRPNWLTRMTHRYVDAIVRLGTTDEQVHLAFLNVMHLTKAPAHLFKPGILLRVVGQSLRYRLPALGRFFLGFRRKEVILGSD